ncbi:hypothetical protein AB0J80_22435 [Actinoplanes sp. NPDC049548]|uniref:hypothetical protein n=1 Tax=Actinoplanes sp. NPDC049548 TaxID=3155152 RepID=UPI00342C98DF
MRLTYCPDTSPADWLVRSGTPPMQLITFGPAVFEAYARLRFIPDPSAPGQSENEVELPGDHPSDIAQVRRALHLRAPFTSAADECYFCLWEGYSDAPLPPDARHGPLVEIPHRRFALFRGSLHDIDAWEAELGGGLPIAPPAYAWPADHRWCLTADVDPHWAGIGAQRAAIDALAGDRSLDVVPARPTESQPNYS